jgi:uncharacterized protein
MLEREVLMDQKEADRKKLLEESKVVAIVGLSENEQKPSNAVARYLKGVGYRIIPVNLTREEILGERSYKKLSDIADTIDIVDIFMRSENVLPIVEEAVKLRPRAIWLQLGIANEDARRLAENAGIFFIQDRCMKQEHTRLVAGNEQ